VTTTVVDGLEIIEIQEENGQRLLRPADPGQRIVEAVFKEGPIG